MNIHLRTASLEDAPFLTDVVIKATLAQGRFPDDTDLDEYRAGFEEWTEETVLGKYPNVSLSVVTLDGVSVGRFRVVRDTESITLAGIQLLPEHQNKEIGSVLVKQLIEEAVEKGIPLQLAVEKNNPDAERFYRRLGFVQIDEGKDEYHLEYRPGMRNI